MAINTGIEILVHSGVGADKWPDIAQRVINVLGGSYTRTMTTPAATYAAGSSSTNEVSITVGGATTDRAIRIVWDDAVVGTDALSDITAKINTVLGNEVLVPTHAAAYAAGTRAYQILLTLT